MRPYLLQLRQGLERIGEVGQKPELVAEAELAPAEDVGHGQPEQVHVPIVEQALVEADPGRAVDADVAVGQRHALGHPGGARGVDQAAHVIEADLRGALQHALGRGLQRGSALGLGADEGDHLGAGQGLGVHLGVVDQHQGLHRAVELVPDPQHGAQQGRVLDDQHLGVGVAQHVRQRLTHQ